MEKENKQVIIKLLLSALLIGVVVLIGYLVFVWLGWNKLSREQIQEYIMSKGAIAPLVFIFVSFLQVTFVPIPGSVTILAGNFLFGFWYSLLYSYIGMMIGSVVACCYFVPYFYLACWATQIACVITIISSDDNPDYKVPWLLFVMILPIVGFMIYFLFYSRKLQKMIRSVVRIFAPLL